MPEPGEARNLPGQAALRYRVGTWASLRRRMLARPRPGDPLARLNADAAGDPAVALLDAWALVGDVVTFYQERIANEGFLRTATEDASAWQLARALGHAPPPGAAAVALLAFTLDDGGRAPRRVPIPVGTRVSSVPGPGEKAQVFETVEPVEACAAWNALPALPRGGRPLQPGQRTLLLAAGAPRVRPGDALLVLDPGAPGAYDTPRVVEAVRAPDGRTRVLLDAALERALAPPARAEAVEAHVLRGRFSLFGRNAPPYRPPSVGPRVTQATTHVTTTQSTDPGGPRVSTTDSDIRTTVPMPPPPPRAAWPGYTLSNVSTKAAGRPDALVVSGARTGIVPGSRLVVRAKGATRAYLAQAVAEAALEEFNLRARVTTVVVEPADVSPFEDALRDAVVLGRSERLPLAREDPGPSWGPVDGLAVEGAAQGLAAGRRVIVSGRLLRAAVVSEGLRLMDDAGRVVRPLAVGEPLRVREAPPGESGPWTVEDATGRVGRVDAPPGALAPLAALADDPVEHEAATLAAEARPGAGSSVLSFQAPLARPFDPATLVVRANVAPASHGQAVSQTLGSGAARKPFQSFALARGPLTRLAARVGAGPGPQIDVLVDGTLWRRVDALATAGPHERAYALEPQVDGSVRVAFGDGSHGARLPTTPAGVEVRYRVGLGTAGNLPAGRLTTLMSRPLGVRSVTNPLPAAGGADPHGADDLREAAPRAVAAPGRVVSLRDHEDFAAAFPGVGMARAVLLRGGPRARVHVTVADDAGRPRPPPGLVDALRAAGAPEGGLDVQGHRGARFGVGARLLVAPDADAPRAKADALASLREAFSFPARRLAQPVEGSEVLAALQRVPGVVAVHGLSLRLGERVERGASARLPCEGARLQGDAVVPAQLLLLDPSDVDLTTEAVP